MRTASGFRRRVGLCTAGATLLSMCVLSAHAHASLPSPPERGSVPRAQVFRSRPALVPQMPSYLALAPALFHYDEVAARSIQAGSASAASADDSRLVPVFHRTEARSQYSPYRALGRYGFGFRETLSSTAIGFDALAYDDVGQLRVGLALDRGTVRVRPKAADGRSLSSYTADGFHARVSWMHADGAWLEGGWREVSYAGDVATLYRGSNAARLHGHGRTLSLGGGLAWKAGHGWSGQSKARLVSQRLGVDDLVDADRLQVRWENTKRTTFTLGQRVEWNGGTFVPFAALDATWSRGGESTVKVGRRHFASGRAGHGLRLAAGSAVNLAKGVQLYGEGVRHRAIGAGGFDGWGVNLGMRAAF
ncbi:autotransporter outer membrane beta-barrel domain-containing protein [Luteibacter sp. CQ10]|uniref:autotransporter outer membrane beta-barrel domain-containing protein n=1 Tax=Luteibacter sp. CQ10 TaxID=2805821 RepID=UPI0034A3A69E